MILLLLIAFLLELIAFFSIGALAFLIEVSTVLQVIIFIILLGIVIGFWGVFMSPKAPRKLNGTKYFVAKGIIYLIVAFVLAVLYGPLFGLSFVGIWIVDELLLYAIGRRSSDSKHS